MQSTLSIFRHFYNNLPPLFPEDMAQTMAATLEKLEGDQDIELREVEDAMINYGYEVWPWRQAYLEFFGKAKEKVGDHMLMPRLSVILRQKCEKYRKYGMSLDDLHSGSPASYFSADERMELARALVDMSKDLHEFASREVVGLGRDEYLDRVEEYVAKLENIRAHLNTMKEMAERESDHPNLANEITSRVRAFEEGLCLLGPEIRHEDVEQAVEFFAGRKQDLNRMRGIHVPVEVDFYGN